VRIVIGEDLFLLREGLVRLLTAHGFEIAAAVGSAPELLRALVDERPDVGIVDVRLPPTHTDDGLRAALAARRQVPGLPVLVLSQYVEQLYARELLAGPGGRRRLPAEGPGVQRRDVHDGHPQRRRGRHRP
jgi:DNA-binding NarL/FixJ family response regulator